MLEAQVIGVGAAGNKAALELLKNGTVVDKNRIMHNCFLYKNYNAKINEKNYIHYSQIQI